jgi:hypothetical protein
MNYKDKHLIAIKTFVQHIKDNAPVETTVKYITKTFFNGNKEFYQDSTNKLRSAGVVMTNRSYYKGKGQKWFYLDNEVDLNILFNVPVNQVPVVSVPVVSVPVNQVPVIEVPVVSVPVIEVPVIEVPVKFKYKGIYEVSEVISSEDKLLAKKVRIDLGNTFCERLFNIETSGIGWSKEKTWFLFDKVMKHMPYESLFD